MRLRYSCSSALLCMRRIDGGEAGDVPSVALPQPHGSAITSPAAPRALATTAAWMGGATIISASA